MQLKAFDLQLKASSLLTTRVEAASHAILRRYGEGDHVALRQCVHPPGGDFGSDLVSDICSFSDNGVTLALYSDFVQQAARTPKIPKP